MYKKRLVYYDEKMRKELEKNMYNIIIGRSYKYIGTFAHKVKYVTDIDISNYVHSKKCSTFEFHVYQSVQNVVKDLPDNMKLLYLTTGFHPDLLPKWRLMSKDKIDGYEYAHTKKMLNKLFKFGKISRKTYDKFMELAKEPTIEILLLLEELLDRKSRVTWNGKEILAGKKVFLGDTFDLKKSLFNIPLKNFFRFMWVYNDAHVLIDVSIYYSGDLSCIDSFKNWKSPIVSNWDRDKRLYLMYYNNEFYWLLRETKYLFKQLYKQGIIGTRQFEIYFESVISLTEDKAGKYKFLYNKLLDYHKILRNNGLDKKEIKKLVMETLHDVKNHVANKHIYQMCSNFIDDYNDHTIEQIKHELKKIAYAVNKFLNDMMYDDMIKYYSIIFELDRYMYTRIPPILDMKK